MLLKCFNFVLSKTVLLYEQALNYLNTSENKQRKMQITIFASPYTPSTTSNPQKV